MWPINRLPQQRVTNHLLSDEGEDVIDIVRHHPVVYVVPVLEALLGVVLWLIAIFGPIQLGWLFILLGVGVICHAVYGAAKQHRDLFVITNMRVFRASGVFTVTIATMPIVRILDITVTKPALGRMLGYGHFVFESAAQSQGLRDIRFIPNPDTRDLVIQRVVQRSGLRGPNPDRVRTQQWSS